MAGALGYLFPGGFDLQLSTNVPGASPPNMPPPTVRHYTSTSTLDTDTMNARVWLGIHFRKAMIDGNGLGHEIVEWSVERYFQPLG